MDNPGTIQLFDARRRAVAGGVIFVKD